LAGVLRSSSARLRSCVFNVFGTVDLLVAIVSATIYNAPVAMGPAYWIAAFWVPLLPVTHYVTLFFFDTAGRAESPDNMLPTEN
jgi:hypothetical protein